MSKLQILLIALGIIALVGVGAYFLGQQNEPQEQLTVGRGDILSPGALRTGYLVATSTDFATSSPLQIEGARRLTLFFGSDLTNDRVIYSAQVSNDREAAQTSNAISTSTPFIVVGGEGPTDSYVVLQNIVASTTGTSTAAIDLSKINYGWIRFILNKENQVASDESANVYYIINY